MSTIRIVGVGIDRTVEIGDGVSITEVTAPEANAGFELKLNGQAITSATVAQNGDIITATPKKVKLGA